MIKTQRRYALSWVESPVWTRVHCHSVLVVRGCDLKRALASWASFVMVCSLTKVLPFPRRCVSQRSAVALSAAGRLFLFPYLVKLVGRPRLSQMKGYPFLRLCFDRDGPTADRLRLPADFAHICFAFVRNFPVVSLVFRRSTSCFAVES